MGEEKPELFEAEEKHEPEVDRIMCFLDQARVCGSDCMSYVTYPVPNKALRGPAQHCLVLSSIERVGRHLPIIAQVLDTGARRSKTAAADRQREEGTPKIDPRPAGPFAASPFPQGRK